MSAIVGFRGEHLYTDIAESLQPIVVTFAGEVDWSEAVLGPIEVWIIWYFVCSMCFTQIIRKALNIQTTPA